MVKFAWYENWSQPGCLKVPVQYILILFCSCLNMHTSFALFHPVHTRTIKKVLKNQNGELPLG